MIFKLSLIINFMPILTTLKNAFQIPDSVIILTEQQVLAQNPQLQQTPEKFNNIPGNTPDPSLYQSILGTPVWSNIEFLPGQYETNTKGVFRQYGSATDGPDRLRYEAVLITVAQEKLIVKTQIQGRNGTVKEYIGMDDFKVTVNGIISGGNGNRPTAQIAGLNKMLIAPVPIEVSCSYLQIFGINWLVLESYELPQDEGGYSYQKFSLSFCSDVQQELELVNL